MIPSEILPDIPRYLTAIAEWFAVVLYSFLIYRKLDIRWIIRAILLGIIQLALQLFAGALPLVWWIPGMLMIIVWMGMSIRLLKRLTIFWTIFFIYKIFMLYVYFTYIYRYTYV